MVANVTNFVSVAQKRQHVLEQLNTYAGEKKELNGSTLVLCPFHAERTPSGRIFHNETSRSPGSFKCYGCGTKAKWDDLAPKLGLKPFTGQKPADEFINLSLITPKVKEELDDLVMDKMEFSDLPEGKCWRGIKTSLLTSIGAKKCQVDHPEHGLLKTKVYLPVFINRKLRGYIKARLTKHTEYPSYINAKGRWSKTHGLFPFDYSISYAKRLGIRTVVLVEGPRDALRLLQAGIPAICILGTQSWSATKSKLLELAGITRIVLMMDGDDAGIQATAMLEESLKTMFQITTLKLWDMADSPYLQFAEEVEPSKAAKAAGVSLWDPGCIPDTIVEKVKRKYFT